ncbi:MAG: hypothetical protein CVV34_04245 [Methanomicrobiales archaeon HGW-Methanomicrobiales-5]|nr:MAG: hypothetical protein CVV34_04245 [Methanomicrobiales archaeon HGW-Methanomicrobiales-5]
MTFFKIFITTDRYLIYYGDYENKELVENRIWIIKISPVNRLWMNTIILFEPLSAGIEKVSSLE